MSRVTLFDPVTRLVAALALVALGALGCGDDAASASEADPSSGCTSNADCPTGSECQFNICAEQTVALNIALLLEPPAFRGDLSALHITQLPARLGSPLPDFALREPIAARGVVLFNATGEGVGSPVDAELRFRSTQGIPGFAFEATTRTSPSTGAYEIILPPGTYDVAIAPDRPDVSRTTAFGVDILSASELRSFSLPAPEQYVVLSGLLVREADTTQPVVGAKVFAATSDGRHESTVDVTDETGRFIILVPPTDAPYDLQVRATADAVWVPRASFAPLAIVGVDELQDQRLSVGAWQEPVPVSLAVQTPDGAPVSDAVLVIRSPLAASESRPGAPGVVSGRYETRVEREAIDASGHVTVLLPPGRAEIYAAPWSPELGLSVPVLIDVDDDLGDTPVPIVLEQRHSVSGFVLDSGGGNGIADVVVEAAPRTSESTPLRRYAVPPSYFGASTVSNFGGDFAFLGQPGTWDVDFIPPVSSGFARTRIQVDVGRAPVSELTVNLPTSGVVQGRVLDSANQPLSGVTVHAFLIDGTTAIPLAETVTEGGVYRLVLPAAAPAAPEPVAEFR